MQKLTNDKLEKGHLHYENLPMQYAVFFSLKIENFIGKKNLMFSIFLLKTLVVGTRQNRLANKYPQSMFWIKNKKNRYTPANPIFVYKSGL